MTATAAAALTVPQAIIAAALADLAQADAQDTGTPVLAPAAILHERLSRAFVLAGRAIFTVRNPQGVRYTFRVKGLESTESRPAAYFVNLLTGPNNTGDYTYVGLLDAATGTIRLTAKSRLTEDSTPLKVARWALRVIWTGADAPAGYSIQHAGRCGRCGRVLTVPESIATGLGPECASRMF